MRRLQQVTEENRRVSPAFILTEFRRGPTGAPAAVFPSPPAIQMVDFRKHPAPATPDTLELPRYPAPGTRRSAVPRTQCVQSSFTTGHILQAFDLEI